MRILAIIVLFLVFSSKGAVAGDYHPDPIEYKVSCYGTYLLIPYDDFAILTGNGAWVLRFLSPYFPKGSQKISFLSPWTDAELHLGEMVRRWAAEAAHFIQKYERQQEFLNRWGAPNWKELLPENGGPRVTAGYSIVKGDKRVYRWWNVELVDFKQAPLGWWESLYGTASGRAIYTLKVYSYGYHETFN